MASQGRTILYYPTIDIPTGSWLRQALLYWDQVGSIVPRSYDDLADQQAIKRYTPDIQFLYQEGVFRPFNPDTLLSESHQSLIKFTNELKQTVGSKQFKEMLVPKAKRRLNTKIYKQKVTEEVFRHLEGIGLAEQRKSRQPDDFFCYYFEPHAALLYMSLLAKHLAKVDKGLTVTGTDRSEFAGISYEPLRKSDSSMGLSVHLRNLLVVPADDTPFKKILAFRKKHREQLLELRTELDKFESKIKSSEDTKEIYSEVTKFRERIENDTMKLETTMRRSRIPTFLGSLQALLRPNSPTLIGTAAVIAGNATSLTTVPVEYIVAGAATAGLIEVVMHLFKKADEKADTINKAPFSYIYFAQKELRAKP